jgi:hypothetical protein
LLEVVLCSSRHLWSPALRLLLQKNRCYDRFVPIMLQLKDRVFVASDGSGMPAISDLAIYEGDFRGAKVRKLS